MYNISVLSNETAGNYSSLTYSYLAPKLQHLDSSSSVFAIGAAVEDEAAGLILAEIKPGFIGEINTIFIKKKFRNIGIGSALLLKMEQLLKQKDCSRLWASYVSGINDTSGIERLMIKHSWCPPMLNMYIYKSTNEHDKLMDAPWIRLSRPPRSFEILPLTKMSLDEQEHVINTGGFPEYLSPFQEKEKLEPDTSLYLRYNGSVAGWIVTHRVAPDTVRYSGIFIYEEFREMGGANFLLVEAIKRHVEKGIPFGTFAVKKENTFMLNFVNRWFMPYLKSVEKSMAVYKIIS